MYEQLKNYQPQNEQEEKDLEAILLFIDRNPDVLVRTNLVAHLTSSAIIMNQKMDKVLFIHHNIYNSWGWVGGHNDGDPDFLNVAIKEAKEETGVTNIKPFSDDILGVDVIYVQNHMKHGAYVPDHVHLNVTYLLVADESDDLTIKPDENSGVKWFSFEEVFNHITEPRMKPIYNKLIHRALKWKSKKETQER